MALREQFTTNRNHGNGHTRSQSQIIANVISTSNNQHQQSNHSRSLSVNEMKVNDNGKMICAGQQNSSEGGDVEKTTESGTGKAPIVANDDL